MTVRQLTILEVIDWYDGIVQGVVSLNGSTGIYLASLLAYDPDLRRRVFALLPLSDGDLTVIKSHIGGEWGALKLHLKHLWRGASGDVVLVCCAGTDEHVIRETVVEASTVKDEAISDIEVAVKESRLSWFNACEETQHSD